jgi:membrane fusion protein (multidrug efflux system)
MSADQNSNTPSTTALHSRRKYLLTLFSGIFLAVGVVFLIYWTFFGRFHEVTDDAYVSGNQVQVMSQITGQVTAILADETNLVKKGNPIVILDKIDAEIALKNAETQLALTVRQVSKLYQNVGELNARVIQQQEALKKTVDDYQRRKKLVVGRVITTEDLEHAEIAVNSAQAELDLAEHQRNAAIALVSNTDLYHHPQIQQAAVKLRDAYLTLERTTIYAPDSGYIAKRPVQVGQQITPNTVLMIIVPLNQVWVDANFKESQLRNFRIGQPVELISDIYGSSVRYHGKIMGLNPGAGDSFDLLPPQNATGNWIKIVQRLPVRIVIDPAELAGHPLRIGLSMTVSVDTHKRSGASLALLPQQAVIYQTKDFSAEYLKQADQLIEQILQENAQNIRLN